MASAAIWPAWVGIGSRTISSAETTNVAALIPKAASVPTRAIRPPAVAEAMICTSRPVDQATELAARRCSSVVRAGMTAWAVALKKVLEMAIPAATT